jgi:4-alpha-glucanotransferase
MKINSGSKRNVKGIPAPDANEEYFIYQTLIEVFPFEGKTSQPFLERMDQYLEKALREGKRNSDWNEINEDYENAVKVFTRKILERGSPFLKSFIPFQKKIAQYGVINSISQLFLKAVSPGVPDFYQGTELWDLSLVDPDNRRQVDYSLRKKILTELQVSFGNDPEILLKDLLKTPKDGRIKLLITHILLGERNADPDLFQYGSYIPLETEGRYREHILAFARVYKNSWFISVIPLFPASIDVRKKEPSVINWKDTAIVLPGFAPEYWTSAFIKGDLRMKSRILISEIMKLPLPAFLRGYREPSTRHAGVLAHISSLPGKYGSGDLGSEAYRFADILRENGQSYWQILPFNPVDRGYGWSPYSSVSAFAGNTIFISPDLLVREGLLNADNLKKATFSESSESDFRRALDFRNLISDEVFTNFFCRNRPFQHSEFEKFCEQQSSWLDDYAMFIILKRENGNAPWIKWPAKYRNRSKKAMEELSEKYASDLRREKLMQYLFDKQWLELKRYCNGKGIKLIGDISFYVNYDSADVWAHPEFFKLDPRKIPLTVSGVPPDYFSETGQLWNMPVYDWNSLKKDGYSWWMRRIRRNLELSDVVRFDHFRAFSEYWEVPFGEKTAVNGQWTPGPGHDFFRSVEKEYPGMPFIAEDLGSIDEKVYRLRDDFRLPGMTVLQFAFGDNTARSGYIPHNFNSNCIVYTGTHDNNTVKGWYMDELEDNKRREASEYAGHRIDEDTCHLDFIRMAYASVAKVAIITVQDLLGLDGSARLNKPSTSDNNWTWKMKRGDLEKIFSPKIRRMVELYGRI